MRNSAARSELRETSKARAERAVWRDCRTSILDLNPRNAANKKTQHTLMSNDTSGPKTPKMVFSTSSLGAFSDLVTLAAARMALDFVE